MSRATAQLVPDFAGLEPGFADPVHGAQTCFRAVLRAMARPGRIERLPSLLAGVPPFPLGLAAASLALSLCDIDTPVWLDEATRPAAAYMTFHCGAPPVASPGEARFAFVGDATVLPPLDSFALGSDEYPERATTVVIEVGALTAGSGACLTGPGIDGQARLAAAEVPARFWHERTALAELFPRGIDVVLVCGDSLAALPRSTRAVL
jgi:alpha-D-ribose 1-methylphosphonate 5-triphosphate synthase subunit PhnH